VSDKFVLFSARLPTQHEEMTGEDDSHVRILANKTLLGKRRKRFVFTILPSALQLNKGGSPTQDSKLAGVLLQQLFAVK